MREAVRQDEHEGLERGEVGSEKACLGVVCEGEGDAIRGQDPVSERRPYPRLQMTVSILQLA